MESKSTKMLTNIVDSLTQQSLYFETSNLKEKKISKKLLPFKTIFLLEYFNGV